MPTINPYFEKTCNTNEQDLTEQLIIESIKVMGIEMVYVPRELVAEDKLFGEDPRSAFIKSYPIEVYTDTVSGFEGDGDFVSKFGVQIRDVASFTVSKKRFQEETGGLRPKEGDLLYFPPSKGLFEIKFVEHEKPFYQLGKNYVFTMNTELFEMSEEEINTGNPEIDSLISKIEYNQFFTVSLTSATAGSFSIGDEVYQSLTAGFATAGVTSTGYFGILQAITGSNGVTAIYEIRNVKGDWDVSSNTQMYYVTKTDNSAFRKLLGITDTVDVLPDANNKLIDEKAVDDQILDFSESNPFGDA